MIERRTIFEHTTEEPQVVSWAEISKTNEQGWRRCNLAFGLGSGAIRSTQVKFEDGDWSQPNSNGIEIAGGLEVSLRPGMRTSEIAHTMRAFWEPGTIWRSLSNAESTFSGNFAHATDGKREYFTDTSKTWDYIAEQFAQYDLLEHLPAVYYGINLSQASQLSPEDQATFGPLAGNFTVPQGHISSVTRSEYNKLDDEGDKLQKAIKFINELKQFADEDPANQQLQSSTNVVIKSARKRAERNRASDSIVLDTANFAPFDDYFNNSRELTTRNQTIAKWGIALARLHGAETDLTQ